jgi:predicted MPP superfamily phosphohydrolase
MEDLRLKRKSIELGHFEAWLTRGRGSFHFENVHFLRMLLRTTLKLTGLLARGERNALNPMVREICFTFDSLPESFCGYKILHLSDIHADSLPGFAEVVADRLSRLQADLCVLTGDYRFEIYGPCHNVYRHMETILARVNTRDGIVGILGNHDFAEEAPVLEHLGVKMLINETVALHRGLETLWVIGLDDPHYYGCDDLPGALRGVPAQSFRILLVHTPELIPEAAASGVNLYLCGHTHGGQICLPVVGPLLVNANCPRRYTQGAWQYAQMKGYTSAGVGASLLPVRFFCPPEIGIIELRCANHGKRRDQHV